MVNTENMFRVSYCITFYSILCALSFRSRIYFSLSLFAYALNSAFDAALVKEKTTSKALNIEYVDDLWILGIKAKRHLRIL